MRKLGKGKCISCDKKIGKKKDYCKSCQEINEAVVQARKANKKQYPGWVCRDCGLKASKGKSFEISCYHKGKCGVCGKTKAVTEPRDFFYPKFK